MSGHMALFAVYCILSRAIKWHTFVQGFQEFFRHSLTDRFAWEETEMG